MSDPNKPTPPSTSGSSAVTKDFFDCLWMVHGRGTSSEPATQSPGSANPPTTGSTPERRSKDTSTPQMQTPRPPRTSSGLFCQGSPDLGSPTPTATTQAAKLPQSLFSNCGGSGQQGSLFSGKPGTPRRLFDGSQRSSLFDSSATPNAGEQPFIGWGAGRNTSLFSSDIPSTRTSAGESPTPTESRQGFNHSTYGAKVMENDIKMVRAREWQAYIQGLGPRPLRGPYYGEDEDGEGEEENKKDEEKTVEKVDEKVDENKGK
ncbi:hypothetical protein F5Y00DRAFT_262361 [Daldinia vernicosa]|uniref:uncharacterized protein n=1 Tax=Daldinia vernicosa TaxID=114800 RepID=UPI002008DC24|nr:uncharacterized protein F5Y00DRAFT_262361 [Daldinia vernicosa]KAI0848574.1 hypothetical protein F5Y00DRAFT_262361 [Daldinia vernicosa]